MDIDEFERYLAEPTPDAPDSLRQAAEAVLDGHNELMALLEREDREAREQQMRERSTDVPHD